MLSTYTIYTMQNCPDCKSAKDLFIREGLNFVEVTEFTPAELIEKVGPVRTLPQIIVTSGLESFHIGGYKDLLSYRKGEQFPRKLG